MLNADSLCLDSFCFGKLYLSLNSLSKGTLHSNISFLWQCTFYVLPSDLTGSLSSSLP